MDSIGYGLSRSKGAQIPTRPQSTETNSPLSKQVNPSKGEKLACERVSGHSQKSKKDYIRLQDLHFLDAMYSRDFDLQELPPLTLV